MQALAVLIGVIDVLWHFEVLLDLFLLLVLHFHSDGLLVDVLSLVAPPWCQSQIRGNHLQMVAVLVTLDLLTLRLQRSRLNLDSLVRVWRHGEVVRGQQVPTGLHVRLVSGLRGEIHLAVIVLDLWL